MAYSMGSIVLQAASDGQRFAFPHSWIMIHEPAKWAGWQSTSAAAQHLERLKQMQDQIYRILSSRSGKPLRQIIRDTKRTDFYLDAQSALDYGLIDAVVAGELPEPKPVPMETTDAHADRGERGRQGDPHVATTQRAGGCSIRTGRQSEPAERVARDSLVSRRAPLFEQPRGVAGDRVQRRRPAERAGARAADHLIERQRLGERRPSWCALLQSARTARRAAPADTARSRRRCR